MWRTQEMCAPVEQEAGVLKRLHGRTIPGTGIVPSNSSISPASWFTAC
jgi:hypothetical protein